MNSKKNQLCIRKRRTSIIGMESKGGRFLPSIWLPKQGKFDLVHHQETNQTVLMKIFSKKRVEDNVVMDELDLMKKLDSPFVARLLSAFQSDNGLYIMMDVHDAQTFREFIFFNGHLKNEHVQFYMAELLLGFNIFTKKTLYIEISHWKLFSSIKMVKWS
uniref:Serine/threonine-protein kinase greatwall n=1 Tax=Caenorhabditis tropicalis TaxID=1561998 RepID=A0A1I7TPE3_9PELO